MTNSQASDAERYRLAQANKMIRLGLVTKGPDGRLVATAAMEQMDSPIVPDAVDFEAVAE